MSDNPVFETIKQEIGDNDVLLFMKGTPMFPQCGFSSQVVQALTKLGVKFKGINVLEDNTIREGIKQFSNWPTIPQLYVKGEFVGGCDIVTEMYLKGELKQLMVDKQVAPGRRLLTPSCLRQDSATPAPPAGVLLSMGHSPSPATLSSQSSQAWIGSSRSNSLSWAAKMRRRVLARRSASVPRVTARST